MAGIARLSSAAALRPAMEELAPTSAPASAPVLPSITSPGVPLRASVPTY
jgi:hypothetical protein